MRHPIAHSGISVVIGAFGLSLLYEGSRFVHVVSSSAARSASARAAEGSRGARARGVGAGVWPAEGAPAEEAPAEEAPAQKAERGLRRGANA